MYSTSPSLTMCLYILYEYGPRNDPSSSIQLSLVQFGLYLKQDQLIMADISVTLQLQVGHQKTAAAEIRQHHYKINIPNFTRI